MKFGVVVFPGSNCDDDMVHVLGRVLDMPVKKLWHKSESLGGLAKGDCVIIPGGFSFGDYLRAGAIARYAPIMQSVVRFAKDGGYVLGICNGFQILCELGLLPGVLLRNKNQKFISKNTFIKAVNTQSLLTRHLSDKKVYQMPIAHAEGRYYTDEHSLEELRGNNQILFQYCDIHGDCSEATNVNGSVAHIAGVCNKKQNVFGMMPHPERASEQVLGSIDGLELFQSLIGSVVTQ